MKKRSRIDSGIPPEEIETGIKSLECTVNDEAVTIGSITFPALPICILPNTIVDSWRPYIDQDHHFFDGQIALIYGQGLQGLIATLAKGSEGEVSHWNVEEITLES